MTTPTAPIPARPPQWTQADLDLAVADGAHDRIRQAQDAGQLHDLLNQRKPEPTQTTPRWSAPITNSDADLARAQRITDEFDKGRQS